MRAGVQRYSAVLSPGGNLALSGQRTKPCPLAKAGRGRFSSRSRLPPVPLRRPARCELPPRQHRCRLLPAAIVSFCRDLISQEEMFSSIYIGRSRTGCAWGGRGRRSAGHRVTSGTCSLVEMSPPKAPSGQKAQQSLVSILSRTLICKKPASRSTPRTT